MTNKKDKAFVGLRLVVEGLENIGIPELKARDKREPGRKQKMEFEDELQRIVVRHFGKQRRFLKDKLQYLAFMHKSLADVYLDGIDEDDDFIAKLMNLLQRATKHGVELFGESILLDMDWTLTNQKAFEWAKKYTYDLVKGIENTTRKLLQSVISQFIDTPRMTIGDVMNLLPFSEDRAQKIAITEITRAYATANEYAGKDLQKQFPDVPVVKRWYTNNDDRVCPICRPLNGMEVPIDMDFSAEGATELGINHPPAHVNCRCWTQTTTNLGGRYE